MNYQIDAAGLLSMLEIIIKKKKKMCSWSLYTLFFYQNGHLYSKWTRIYSCETINTSKYTKKYIFTFEYVVWNYSTIINLYLETSLLLMSPIVTVCIQSMLGDLWILLFCSTRCCGQYYYEKYAKDHTLRIYQTKYSIRAPLEYYL